MIRVAIVDDDRKDIQQLQAYLEQYRRESGEAMDFRLPPPETEPWTLFALHEIS